MATKDGAWNSDGKLIVGIDVFGNQHPLNCDILGTLDVNATLTSGSIEIGKVDQGTPNSAANAWPVYLTVSGVAIDPRQIRTLTTADQVTAFQGGVWTTGRTWSLLNTTDSVNVGNFPATQPISGTVAVSNFPATQPVSGTVTANQGTSPWIVSGTVTANAGSGTFLVDGSAHTQPISGTVTANLGTVDGLALDATLTNSTQKTQIVQGGNTAVVDAAGDQQVDVNNFPALQSVNIFSQAGPLSISEPLPNTGNVYRFGGDVVMAAVTPTDVITLTGSATKIVRVLSLELFLVRTTAGINQVFLFRGLIPNTGGTFTTSNGIEDGTGSASTAVITLYTANPTLGLRNRISELLLAGGGTAYQGGYRLDFMNGIWGKGLVLTGTNQSLAISLNGVTVAGGQLFANIVWREE